MSPNVMRNLLKIVSALKELGWKEGVSNGIKLEKGFNHAEGNQDCDQLATVDLSWDGGTGVYVAKGKVYIYHPHRTVTGVQQFRIETRDHVRIAYAVVDIVQSHSDYHL